MNVAVDAAGGDDLALAADDLGAGTDDDIDTRLDVGVAGLADAADAAAGDADIGLDDAAMVDDHGVGDDGIGGAVGAADLALPHAVADHLAAAELDLLAVDRAVALDRDEELGVGKSDAVARRRTEHPGIGAALHAYRHHSAPLILPLKPKTRRAPS